MIDADVEIEVKGSAVWITLQRPHKRNAITADMWDRIYEATSQYAGREGITALVIQGAGGAFTAGADLASVKDSHGNLAADYHHRAFRALGAIRRFPGPTLAVIDGPCVGAGCSIALSCDVRFATPRSFFAVPAVKLGIVYEEWSVARLVELMGSGHTNRFLLTGRRLPATEAAAIRLIEVCSETVHADVADHLAALAAGDSGAAAETRKAIRRLAGPLDEHPLPVEEMSS